MFRFENNMPEYWENQSRDFQLLTRLDDAIFMGQRADIATITNLNSSKKCKNTFLSLLAKKVGFFTDEYIEDSVLRNIIGAFRQAVKHKGTKLGIFYAVTAILKAENTSELPKIDIDNFTIKIYTPINIKNKVALKEFLKYIIPAGFTVDIFSYNSNSPKNILVFNNIDTVYYYLTNINNFSTIRNNNSVKKTNIGNEINDIPIDSNDYNKSNYIPIDFNNYSKNDTIGEYMSNIYAGSATLGTVMETKNPKYIPDKKKDKEGNTTSNSEPNNGVTIVK